MVLMVVFSAGIYILAISPIPWGKGEFLKNREGGLEKRKGKGGEKKIKKEKH